MRHLLAPGVLLFIFALSISDQALLQVASHLKYGLDIVDYCRILNKRLDEAEKKDRSLDNWYKLVGNGFGEQNRLYVALNTLAHGVSCPDTSLEIAATLIDCKSGIKISRKAFVDAISAYERKCIDYPFLESTITDATSSPSHESLKNFMDSNFLATYREDNPRDEHALPRSNRYCHLKLAHNSIIKSIQSHGGVINDRKSLEDHLDKHLVKPCERYRDQVSKVMYEMRTVSRSEDSIWVEGVLGSLSQENKDAICRFDICEGLKDGSDELVQELVKELNQFK